VNVGDLTSRNAWRRPGGDAIIDVKDGRRLGFAALDERSNRLAHGLRDGLGLARGDRVAILSRNAAEVLETFFACAKAGLVAQPLNWRLAPPELARILGDGDPRVLVASRGFADDVAELQRRHDLEHWLDFAPGEPSPYEDLLAANDAERPRWADEVGGGDDFFILYTGGTTGVSKGVLHTHDSTLAAMANQTVAERVTVDDVYLLLGQMFHIPVVLAMNYLAHGRPVVLLDFEPRTTLEVIEAERVSAFLGITTMVNYLLDVPGLERFDLSSLRLIMYGGGPMPETVVRRSMEAFPCGLMQGYGQTEGCTYSFLLPWVHREIAQGIGTHRVKSCGQESHLTSLRVVDDEGRPVPRDRTTIGEIVVKGPSLMKGYWRRPAEDAEAFRDGGGWLRTGDVATWDEDGFLYIVDRAKDMVISGGENIYPAQVEEVIYRHPGVLEVAVVGIPDDTWGEALHAVVVARDGATVTAEEIVDLTRRELAGYMKPKSVEFVTALPKGPTGKILKSDLREPHWAGRERVV
jgi:acyl-CoA synthetase (AMP-forming)/AMP-acid ligase II